ncbi:MAG: hypothetical protein LBN29_13825 [Mediterranea sp.]|jgi:hypothetical protein|nr:hypothetical protein [Mediterranea sp.]
MKKVLLMAMFGILLCLALVSCSDHSLKNAKYYGTGYFPNYPDVISSWILTESDLDLTADFEPNTFAFRHFQPDTLNPGQFIFAQPMAFILNDEDNKKYRYMGVPALGTAKKLNEARTVALVSLKSGKTISQNPDSAYRHSIHIRFYDITGGKSGQLGDMASYENVHYSDEHYSADYAQGRNEIFDKAVTFIAKIKKGTHETNSIAVMRDNIRCLSSGRLSALYDSLQNQPEIADMLDSDLAYDQRTDRPSLGRWQKLGYRTRDVMAVAWLKKEKVQGAPDAVNLFDVHLLSPKVFCQAADEKSLIALIDKPGIGEVVTYQNGSQGFGSVYKIYLVDISTMEMVAVYKHRLNPPQSIIVRSGSSSSNVSKLDTNWMLQYLVKYEQRARK